MVEGRRSTARREPAAAATSPCLLPASASPAPAGSMAAARGWQQRGGRRGAESEEEDEASQFQRDLQRRASEMRFSTAREAVRVLRRSIDEIRSRAALEEMDLSLEPSCRHAVSRSSNQLLYNLHVALREPSFLDAFIREGGTVALFDLYDSSHGTQLQPEVLRVVGRLARTPQGATVVSTSDNLRKTVRTVVAFPEMAVSPSGGLGLAAGHAGVVRRTPQHNRVTGHALKNAHHSLEILVALSHHGHSERVHRAFCAEFNLAAEPAVVGGGGGGGGGISGAEAEGACYGQSLRRVLQACGTSHLNAAQGVLLFLAAAGAGLADPAPLVAAVRPTAPPAAWAAGGAAAPPSLHQVIRGYLKVADTQVQSLALAVLIALRPAAPAPPAAASRHLHQQHPPPLSLDTTSAGPAPLPSAAALRDPEETAYRLPFLLNINGANDNAAYSGSPACAAAKEVIYSAKNLKQSAEVLAAQGGGGAPPARAAAAPPSGSLKALVMGATPAGCPAAPAVIPSVAQCPIGAVYIREMLSHAVWAVLQGDAASAEGLERAGRFNIESEQGVASQQLGFAVLESEVRCAEASLPAQLRIKTSFLRNLTTVGRGSFGTVFRAEYTATGREHVAVKELKTSRSEPPLSRLHKKRAFIRETADLMRLRHNSIVNFYGWVREANGTEWMVTEYCSGGTLTSLTHGTPLSPVERGRACLQVGLCIGQALAYLHSRSPRLVHLDVAARNVLVCSSGVFKLGDVGSLRKEGDVDPIICVPWAPPEALEVAAPYRCRPSYDVWAFACLLWEVLEGGTPYSKLMPEASESGTPFAALVREETLGGRTPPPPYPVAEDGLSRSIWDAAIAPSWVSEGSRLATLEVLAALQQLQEDFPPPVRVSPTSPASAQLSGFDTAVGGEYFGATPATPGGGWGGGGGGGGGGDPSGGSSASPSSVHTDVEVVPEGDLHMYYPYATRGDAAPWSSPASSRRYHLA